MDNRTAIYGGHHYPNNYTARDVGFYDFWLGTGLEDIIDNALSLDAGFISQLILARRSQLVTQALASQVQILYELSMHEELDMRHSATVLQCSTMPDFVVLLGHCQVELHRCLAKQSMWRENVS